MHAAYRTLTGGPPNAVNLISPVTPRRDSTYRGWREARPPAKMVLCFKPTTSQEATDGNFLSRDGSRQGPT